MSKGISREEKKAIERCKELIKNEHKQWIGISNQLAIEAVLNLIEKQQCKLEINEANLLGFSRQIEKDDLKIEKQQKEIERLRDGRNFLSEHISAQLFTPELFDRVVEENYIPKEVIKEKIKELEKIKNKEPISEEENISEYIYRSIENLDYEFAQAVIRILKELLGE